MSMPRSYRSAFSKFRSAPLCLETGRYTNESVCFHCSESVEDERHAILHCPLYDELRERLYDSACFSYPNFPDMKKKKCLFWSHSYTDKS